VKIRKGPIIDPKWKTAYHARRRHCYWLIFRKSSKCQKRALLPARSQANSVPRYQK
jgi:hypothetical protein